MQKLLVGAVVATLAIVALPQLLMAQQDGKWPDASRPDAPATRPAPPKFEKGPAAKHDGKHDGYHHQHAMLDGVKPGDQKAHGFAKAIFDRLDTNHDGVLSFEEFSAGLRQLRHAFAAPAHAQVAQKADGKQGPQFAGHHPQGPGFAAGHPWQPQGPGPDFAQGRAWRPEGHVIIETQTWRREVREYGDSRPWQPEARQFAQERPLPPRHVLASMTAPRPDFGQAVPHPDFKKPECQKPCCQKPVCPKAACPKECKKPECTKPVAKAADHKAAAKDHAAKKAAVASLETRVASLEKQQAEILSLLHKLVRSSSNDTPKSRR